MKLIATFSLTIVLGLTAFEGASHAGTVQLPYQTPGQLASKCKAAGGTFLGGKSFLCEAKGGSVYCDKITKTCKGVCEACGSKAVTKSLTEVLGSLKKRPRVLQEGNGGDDPGGTVKPTVLGSGNPRATPDGDMPDITGDGASQ